MSNKYINSGTGCLLVACESSAFVHRRESAIALSNAGVALLKRDCYGQAIHCFQDSFDLIRAAHPGPQGLLPNQCEATSYKLLHEASERLANPIPDRLDETLHLSYFTDTDKGPTKEFVASTISNNLYRSAPIAITIERSHLHHEKTTDVNDLDLDSTIILHNYSVACRYLSYAQEETQQQDMFMEEAFKHARMACSTLEQYSHHRVSNDSGRATQSTRLELLSLLAFQNMVQLCFCLNMKDEGLKYVKKVGYIRVNVMSKTFVATRKPLVANQRSASAA